MHFALSYWQQAPLLKTTKPKKHTPTNLCAVAIKETIPKNGSFGTWRHSKFDRHNTMDLCQMAMKKKIKSIYIQWPQSANNVKRGEISKIFQLSTNRKGYCQLICQVKDIARLWVEAGAKNLRSVISSWGSCIWASLHSFSCFIFFALSHKPLNK